MSKDDAIIILQNSAIDIFFVNMMTEFNIHHYQYRVIHAHAARSNFSKKSKCYKSFIGAPVFDSLQEAYDYAGIMMKRIARSTLPVEYGILIMQDYKHLTFNQLKVSHDLGGKMIEIYTRTDCDFCVKAKDLLMNNNLNYKEYIIGEDIDREVVVTKFPNVKLLPVIAIDGKYVGGYAELLDTIYPSMEKDT